MRCCPGGEVAEPGATALSDEDLRRVSLGGGGRWILLEPGAGPLSAVARRPRSTRWRHAASRAWSPTPSGISSPDLAERLRDATRRGALVQVTAALLEDGPAAETLLDLVARGLVHVVASDAHSSHGGRPVRLSGALARIRSAGVPAARVRWIVEEAPAAIVRGAPVAPPA